MSEEARDAVRRIEAILDGGSLPALPDPGRDAVRYAELCAEANRRLRECRTLFAQNQASDAIRAAERPPDLFGLIGRLDFPRANAWREHCARNGWQTPAPLDAGAIDELNDGYARHAPAEELAAGFRQAVHAGDTRAAVRWLRALMERDPDNSAWASQLPSFEVLRLDEIRRSIAQLDLTAPPAAAALPGLLRDQVGALEALRKELRCRWTDVQEAERLLGQVTERLRDRQRRLAFLAGEALADDIGVAHAARTWTALAELLARFDTLRAGGFLQPPERMATIVQQARQDWEDQRRRDLEDADFAELLTRIRRELFETLDPGPDLVVWCDELRKRFGDRPLPEEIEQRLAPALALLAGRAARARRLRTLGISALATAAVLFAAAGAAWFAWHSTESRWAGEILHAIERRDAEGAGQLIETLSRQHPRLWRSARLRALEPPLDALRQQIAANRRQGDLLVAQATALRDGGWSADPQEVNAVFTAVARLEATGGTDLTADQRDRLAALRSERETVTARRQGERDAAFAVTLDEVRVGLEGLGVDALVAEDLRRTLEQSAELLRRCDVLRREPGVSRELMEAGLARLEAPLRRLHDVGEQRLKALSELHRAAGLGTFLEALAALLALYGGDARLAASPAVLENKADYLLFAAYAGADLSDPSRPGLAAEILRASERVGPANSFWTDPLLCYGAHLQGLSAVPDVRAALQRLARNDLLGRLWSVTLYSADGRPFTGVLRWPDDLDLAGLFDSRKGKMRLNNLPVTGVRVTSGAYYVPARGDTIPEFLDIDVETPVIVTAVTPRGHCTFLRRVAEELPEDSAQLPDYLLQRIVALHQDMSICPYLKMQLLAEFIALYGSLTGQPLLPTALTRLQQASVDIGREVNWLCTESDDHLRVREKAVFALTQSAVDARSMQAEQRLALALAEAVLWRGVFWAGFAAVDGGGGLVLCRPGTECLWVLRPVGLAKELRPVEVATEPDGAGFRPAVAGFLLPGEPVFVPRAETPSERLIQSVASRRGVNPEILRRQLESRRAWPQSVTSGRQ
jgi:hypothetical protein